MAAPSSSTPPKLSAECSIENLPEHLLLHILSFLPTKNAAATALLSKQWQHRWTLAPSLDLHHSPFKLNFSTLVDSALARHKAPFLRRFRLITNTYGPVSHSHLSSWISSAMDRHFLELHLNIFRILDDCRFAGAGINFVLCFPPKICYSLVSLKLCLSDCYERILIGGSPGDLYFPALKIMHLRFVGFDCGEVSLSGFLTSSRFPVLEELAVHESKFDYDEINISLSTLRSLLVSFTALKLIRRCTLKIECPSLQCLVLKDSVSRVFCVGNLSKLVEATVDVWNKQDDEDEFYGESLMNFVHTISNVKILKLSLHTMRELQRASLHSFFHIPPFHNLAEVDFVLDDSVLCMTTILLHKFENVQRLTFLMDGDATDNKTEWVSPTQVPNCLADRLTTFCVRNFKGFESEIEAIKYILENSMVLKNVDINFHYNDTTREKRDDLERELSSTSRGYECQLKFVDPLRWTSR